MYVKKTWLLAALLVAMMATPINGTACSNINPFLSDPNFSSLQLPSVTATASSICAGLWRTHGTCCNEASTVQKAIDNQNYMNTQISNFNNQMNTLRNQIIGASARPIFSHPELAFFRRLIDWTVYNNFISRSGTCWNYLGSQRNAALCSICSGNSAIFFNKLGAKAWVDLPTCAVTLKTCSVYLSEITKLIEGVQRLLRIFHNYDPTISTQLTWWTDHFNWVIGFANLMEYLTKFNSPLSTQDRINAEVHLCNRIMLLKRVPVIYHVNDKLNRINMGFNSLIDTLARINNSRLLSLLKIRSDFSRSLEEIGSGINQLTSTGTFTFNHGDIDLLGSSGSTQGATGDQPMNLTQRLP
jgi:hypothetical protein